MYPTFPPEIVDSFIDYLYDDKPALLACGLTCKDWTPSSRYHLFSELNIKLRPNDLFSLLDLLSSPLGQIAPYVRSFAIDSITSFLYYDGAEPVSTAIRNLPRLISRLPAVKTLRLSNFNLENFPQDIIAKLFGKFHDFTDVALCGLHFLRFSEFVLLVGAFPKLERMSVRWVSWTYSGQPSHALGRVFPRIAWHIFEIHRCTNIKDLAEWLLLHHPSPLTYTLCYEMSGPDTHSAMRALFQCAAPSVRHLQLAFPMFARVSDVRETMHDLLDLRGCTALRSLRLRNILLWPDDPLTPLIRPWVPALLAQIPSMHIEHVTLELHLPPDARSVEDAFAELDWAGIVSALFRAPFRGLSRLAVVIGPGVVINAARAARFLHEDKLAAFSSILEVDFRANYECY